MRSAFSLVPPYVRTTGSAGEVYGLPWFSEYGFQQTRGFRALKVWMAMQQFGLEGYKAAIEENIALAQYLADRVQTSADLDLRAPPSLSIVCFRYADAALRTEDQIAGANRVILEKLQLGGDAFITGTELAGRFVLRACIVNYRSTRTDVDRMLDAVRTIGGAIVRAGTPRLPGAGCVAGGLPDLTGGVADRPAGVANRVANGVPVSVASGDSRLPAGVRRLPLRLVHGLPRFAHRLVHLAVHVSADVVVMPAVVRQGGPTQQGDGRGRQSEQEE